MRLPALFVVGLFGLTAHVALAQSSLNCTAAQRTLEQTIREYPERAVATLTATLRGNLACAGPLTESAITASDASDELVAKLVSAAVRAAPDKAVVIAEAAIAASPSASDEVADVVQTVLGDCSSIAEDVTISIGKNKGRLLVILEDALRSHGNCSCEIVSAAVKSAGSSQSVIAQIVETAVTLKPTMAAEISECASAAAPRQLAAVQQGLDRALSDSTRGPGALPAAAEVNVPAVEEEAGKLEAYSPEDASASYQTEAAAHSSSNSASSDSSGYQQSSYQGYGKNSTRSYGKNSKQGYSSPEEAPKSDDWGWDWINWGGGGGGGAPVYMIAPSGGVVPPGELVPLSPSDPKIDEAEKED